MIGLRDRIEGGTLQRTEWEGVITFFPFWLVLAVWLHMRETLEENHFSRAYTPPFG